MTKVGLNKLRVLAFEIEHSILTKCYQCGGMGMNLPDDYLCGNCGSDHTQEYSPIRHADLKNLFSHIAEQDARPAEETELKKSEYNRACSLVIEPDAANERIRELEKEIAVRDKALNLMAGDQDVEGVPSSLGYYLKKARAEMEGK